MQSLKNDTAIKRAEYLDNLILYTGAAVPVGMIIGNIGFEVMIALTGLAWLIRSFLLRENPFSRIFMKPAILTWAAWLCCIFLSLAINGPGAKGVWHDIVYFRFFFYACAMIDLSTRKDITVYMLWGLAAGVSFAAFNTIMAYGVGFDLFGRAWEQYTIKLRIAARIAAMGAMTAPVFWGWAMASRSEKLKNWGFIFVICGIAVLNTIHTRIRTAIIALFAGIFFAFICNRYKKMKWIEKIFWFALTVFVIWFIIRQGAGWGFSSVYDRIAIWKVSL
ncbi:MAG: hypothetical protein HN417_10725, partial [Desulfobacula sp.]|nr:hypothetical protein [Desulfobacula sp.]